MAGEFMNQIKENLISSSLDDDIDDYQERMYLQKYPTGQFIGNV
jgi:hypothetical protein